jgi:hypothetical protein
VNEAGRGERRYAWTMAQSDVPDRLRPLVEQLQQLSAEERLSVIRAANDSSAGELPTIPWDVFRQAKGIVGLGGNAVDDCEALYDRV